MPVAETVRVTFAPCSIPSAVPSTVNAASPSLTSTSLPVSACLMTPSKRHAAWTATGESGHVSPTLTALPGSSPGRHCGLKCSVTRSSSSRVSGPAGE